MSYQESLNPEKALIWRIVHRDNIEWILDNGLHAGNSSVCADNWVHIGNPELISKRSTHPVPIGPGGTLHDYIPFYFTPFSPMLKNIQSGWGGVKKRDNSEIVILVSSLRSIDRQGIPFVFTDSHAYYMWSSFYNDLSDLDKIDWEIIQKRDFKRDADDPAKFERYQAEALIHKHVPVEALVGMACFSDDVKQYLEQLIQKSGQSLQVVTRPGWYFS
ncbi:type II toxin-antitoxin system toxin DNA ADP-ribosyl transferase DarT [Vibrio vulnificus]|uniref:type II toxin-antitoxin system toxin DNA ADP-ribosyl transferase DarT n=1 Tax=Vibrio vulnificus TaxID=672 RepID=UPI00102C9D2A|nr:DUF4433 domain-containing protein [Vibrio vulnificus]RZR50516.1 DUF4433 domain-containing protein [Vibrio vulnificus]